MARARASDVGDRLRPLGDVRRARPETKVIVHEAGPDDEDYEWLENVLVPLAHQSPEALREVGLGVLTREAVVGEAWPGGFASLYPVLRAMEESGRIRRGYFVEGLGGSQFALPGAVDRLRSLRESGGAVIAMAATDPANAYGTVLSWPQSDGRMARAAGAYCVVDDGRLALYLERGGRSLLTNGEVEPAHLQALIAIATNAGRLEVQKVDGVSVMDSPLKAALREAGFSQTHRSLVAYGARG